jgi:ABC-type sugar transport system substrate-binding protein
MNVVSNRVAALLVVCAAVAAGCGSDDDGGSGAGGGGTKSVNLAFVYPTTETNFAQEMAMGAKSAAADLEGVNLKESAPANVDGPKEVQLFQAATRASKDGVAMMTLTPTCSCAR